MISILSIFILQQQRVNRCRSFCFVAQCVPSLPFFVIILLRQRKAIRIGGGRRRCFLNLYDAILIGRRGLVICRCFVVFRQKHTWAFVSEDVLCRWAVELLLELLDIRCQLKIALFDLLDLIQQRLVCCLVFVYIFHKITNLLLEEQYRRFQMHDALAIAGVAEFGAKLVVRV